MLPQSVGVCEQHKQLYESLAQAIAEIDWLRLDYENAKRLGAANAGKLQFALNKARAGGRAIQQALAEHVQQHQCKKS